MDEATRLKTLFEMAKEHQNSKSIASYLTSEQLARPRYLPELDKVLKRINRPAPAGWLDKEYGLPLKL